MTLEDLDQSLPSGLHDAQIIKLSHDYERGEVALRVKLLVGLPDEPQPYKYRYRTGEIRFSKTLFCTVEMLENERVLGHPSSIWFTYARTERGILAEKVSSKLAPEILLYSLYILDWESEIHIGASDVSFRWLETDQII